MGTKYLTLYSYITDMNRTENVTSLAMSKCEIMRMASGPFLSFQSPLRVIYPLSGIYYTLELGRSILIIRPCMHTLTQQMTQPILVGQL